MGESRVKAHLKAERGNSAGSMPRISQWLMTACIITSGDLESQSSSCTFMQRCSGYDLQPAGATLPARPCAFACPFALPPIALRCRFPPPQTPTTARAMGQKRGFPKYRIAPIATGNTQVLLTSGFGRVRWTALRAEAGGQKSTEEALLAAVDAGDAEEVDRILKAGASAQTTDDWGTTCLQMAVKAGHSEVVRTLLNSGADPNSASVSDDETTPLHFAVLKGYKDIVTLLLASGATMAKPDEFGDLPIDIAKRRNDRALVQLLKNTSPQSAKGDKADRRRVPLDSSAAQGEGEPGAGASYRDKSYTEYGGEQMLGAEARQLAHDAVDWDAAYLGREVEEGYLVEMVENPTTGEQLFRRLPLKPGASVLFPKPPRAPDDTGASPNRNQSPKQSQRQRQSQRPPIDVTATESDFEDGWGGGEEGKGGKG